jgi:hypothetical protein
VVSLIPTSQAAGGQDQILEIVRVQALPEGGEILRFTVNYKFQAFSPIPEF